MSQCLCNSHYTLCTNVTLRTAPPCHTPRPVHTGLALADLFWDGVEPQLTICSRKLSRSGSYARPDHTQVPLGLADLFQDIVESQFRVDLSSTELRAQALSEDAMGARPSGASRVE